MASIYGDEYRILILRLKELRLDSKMTQEELANYLGKGQSYVSKYEQNQKRLDIFEVRAICLACAKDFSEFIIELEYKLKGEK